MSQATLVGTRDDFALARHTGDGILDTSFGTGGKVTTDFAGSTDQAWTVLIQADGKIVVAGHAFTALGFDFALARYTGDGILDTSFGAGGKVTTPIAAGADRYTAALLQPDGKIVVAGSVSDESTGVDPDFGVVRYTSDGALDPSFGVGGIVRTDFGLGDKWVQPNDLALQSDGKLVVVGRVTLAPWPTGPTCALARFEATGALDASFGTGGLVTTSFYSTQTWSEAHAVAIQADGKIVIAGHASDGTQTDFAMARYTTDGALDASFGNAGTLVVDFFGASDIAECIATQADGKIVVGGSARNVNTTILALVRILP